MEKPLNNDISRAARLCDHIARKGLYSVLLLLPLVYFPPSYWIFEIPKVTFLRLATIVILAAWLARGIMAREFTVRRPPASLPVLAYLAVFILSTTLSISPVISLFGERGREDGLLTVANMMLLFFLAVNILTATKQILLCRTLIVISATAVSAIGILQYLNLIPMSVLPPSTFQGRPFSTLSNPDFLFSYLSLAIPITVIACVRRPLQYSLPLLVMLTSVILTLPTNQENTGRSELSLETINEIVPDRASRTIVHIKNKSMRLQPIIQIIKDRPLLGSGPNTLKSTFTRYEPPAWTDPDVRTDKAHNEFLEVAATMGLPGLAAYVWMLVSLGLFSWQSLARSKISTPQGSFAVGICLAFLAYTAQTMVIFHSLAAYTTFWLMMAAGAGIYLAGRPSEHHWRFEVPRLVRPLLLPTGLVLAAWLTFLSVRPAVADVYFKKSELNKFQGSNNLAEQVLLLETAVRWNEFNWFYNASYALSLSELALHTTDTGLKERMLQEAERYASREVMRSPYDASMYFVRAVVLTRRGGDRRDAVIADLEKAVELYPRYFQANYLLATQEKLRGNFERAIAARKAAVEIIPGDFDVLFELGDDYFKAGKTELAIRTWENARRVNPTSTKASFALGMAHESLGDLGQAGRFYQAVRQMNPIYPGIDEAIGRVSDLTSRK